jgi:hypothetical protein
MFSLSKAIYHTQKILTQNHTSPPHPFLQVTIATLTYEQQKKMLEKTNKQNYAEYENKG